MVTLDREFQMTLLTEEGEAVLFCRARFIRGRRLIAEISNPIPQNACIRIGCDDSALLGEVLACWDEGITVLVAIEMHQILIGLAELASLREDVWRQYEPAGLALTGVA